MPFVELDVKKEIEEKRQTDDRFKKVWDESRQEYALLGELIKIRKNANLSQTQLADLIGNKQQVISRIENKENSPNLKTLCNILDVLGYEIKLVPKAWNNSVVRT